MALRQIENSILLLPLRKICTAVKGNSFFDGASGIKLSINIDNNRELFENYGFTGLSNFDFFSSDYIVRHTASLPPSFDFR